MAITVKSKKAATAETTIEKKSKGQVLTTDTVSEQVPTQTHTEIVQKVDGPTKAASPYCEVGFEAGMTHNMGNMEFVKVTVHINVPCLAPEIDEAFEYAKTWVDEKLSKVNAEIKGA